MSATIEQMGAELAKVVAGEMEGITSAHLVIFRGNFRWVLFGNDFGTYAAKTFAEAKGKLPTPSNLAAKLRKQAAEMIEQADELEGGAE